MPLVPGIMADITDLHRKWKAAVVGISPGNVNACCMGSWTTDFN